MLGRIDDLAVAAHGIGLRIQALAFVPGLGISQATAALVGQALGASDVERAKKIVRASVIFCVVTMSALALAVIIAAFPIVGIFNVESGTKVETYAVQWMRILGYGMPVVGWHIALVGLFQGSGATRTSLRINTVGTLLCQIPLGYLLAFPIRAGRLWPVAQLPDLFRGQARARDCRLPCREVGNHRASGPRLKLASFYGKGLSPQLRWPTPFSVARDALVSV